MESMASNKYDALLFECMAVEPKCQDFLEHKIMHSHIGVITNIREDHVEEMGESLEEIALSLSNTIPNNGILILGEERKFLQDIIIQEAQKQNTEVILADTSKITDKEVNKFSYFQHKTNIAIGYAFAEYLGIDKKTALTGMIEARPDVGNFNVYPIIQNGVTIHWANLFAVNDRESFIETAKIIVQEKQYTGMRSAVILNNRQDRPKRVEQFAQIVTETIPFDYYITFGYYEDEINSYMQKVNAPSKLINMGHATDT